MYILNEGQKRRGRLKHEFLHRSKDAKISQFEEYITNKYNERHSMSASGTLDNVLEQVPTSKSNRQLF
jgi:hypothetical protein